MAEDSTTRLVHRIVTDGVRAAYVGYQRHGFDPMCVCGDASSAHYGVDGEGACGERGCDCQQFRKDERP